MKRIDSDKRNAVLRRPFPISFRKSTVRGSGLYEQTNPEQWVSIPIRNGYQAMVSAIRFSQRRIFRPGIGEHS